MALWKKRNKVSMHIGVGRFVEVMEQKYSAPEFQLKNPKMRIECSEKGLEVTITEFFSSNKINLSKSDALSLAAAITKHFQTENNE